MFLQSKTTINIFDKYRLTMQPKLKCHQDGTPGKRVLFITDHIKSFIVYFEEGMEMYDMRKDTENSMPAVTFQCCKGSKYIHFKRNSGDRTSCGYFHIELEDDDGKVWNLPGQMTVPSGYKWADGIEPVLMEILEGLTIE